MNKQSKKRGTKIQHIVSSMIMLMIFLSLFLCSNNSFIYSGAKATSSSSVVFDTNFMHSPVSAIEYGDTTLVLDSYTNSIIKVKDEKIIQGENSTTSARNANFMFYFNSTIVLVNSKGQTLQEMITLLDAETLDIKYQAQTFDTTVYPYYDRISSYIDNNTLYLFFYSFGVNNGVSDMMLLSISSDGQNFTIHEPHVLELNQDTVGNTFSSNVISINIVKTPTSDKLSCLVHTSTDVFSSEIIGNTISTIASTSIMSDIDSNFKNIKILSIDSNPYVMIEKENSINLYKLETNESGLFKLSTTLTNVETNLPSHDSIFINDTSIIICSSLGQKLFKSSIEFNNNEFVLSNPLLITNPSMQHVLYESKELSLGEITSDTNVNLLPLPYSTNSVISLSPNTNVIEIGEGKIVRTNGESETVNGYKYYLVTVNGTNYYGYLPISSVTHLETSDSSVPYAFTRKNVKMYKYPTNSPDEINTILITFEEITKVELVRDISNFSYTVGSNNSLRKFYEVQYNNQIGYILSTDIDSFPEIELVQTNAEIRKATSVYKNLNDELPTWNLSEGTRVRILENRFGTEKYTKISFNDDDGVTCTGYILADNVQADSWSTLQVIGLILVVLSLVLLVILLIVRHRINKE